MPPKPALVELSAGERDAASVPSKPVTAPSRLPSRLALLRRRFPRRPTFALYFAAMGPGLIASLAGNDAGGIGTYSLAGATYGYNLLGLLFIITFVLALVQEMAARMGAVTQKGLGELIREQYGVGWTLFALGVMFVANAATTVAEFAGVAAAGEIFGLSKYFTVPVAAIVMWLIVSRGPFRLVERLFIGIGLVQLTYLVAALRAVATLPAGQRWGHILSQLVWPGMARDPHLANTLLRDPKFLLLAVAVIGTTVTPYMQFFLQSSIVDKGIQVSEYRYQKADVYIGTVATNLIAFFIVVCTAATLYAGHVPVEQAKDAALALSKPLGSYGTYLFAAGLLSASLLAAAVLPLSTAYTYCESFGWEIGLERTFKQAPMFYGIFTLTMALAALLVLPPRVPLLATMVISQDVNGLLLPIVLVFMLKLINDRRIMGDYVNNRVHNLIAWSTVSVLILLTVILLISSLFGLG